MERKTLIASQYFQPARLQKITAAKLVPTKCKNITKAKIFPHYYQEITTRDMFLGSCKISSKKVSSLVVPSCMFDISKNRAENIVTMSTFRYNLCLGEKK